MSDRSVYESFLAGFIVGGLTGGLVALLLAPQAGQKTREWFSEKSAELRERAWQLAEETHGRPAFAEEWRRRHEVMAPAESHGSGGGWPREAATATSEPSGSGEGRPKNQPDEK